MILDGAVARLRHEHNERAWAAWHVAYLTAYAPEKSREFVGLSRLIQADKPKHKSPADWESTFAAFSAWASPRKE